MPATHKKLTIGGEQTAAQATAYLSDPQATGDYYSESSHAFMRWVASDRAKTVLGLNPEVELWKVERLMNGQHPSSGRSIRRWGPNGTMIGAHDVTVSPAPKSVSVVWAMADAELRREIELMVGQASDVAFRRMLRRIPLIKERYGPGPNDLRLVKADDYVAVEALHTTARLTEAKPNVPDPDLHLHCVLFGAVDAKGQLRAIDSLQIRKHRAELGAHASAELAEMFRLRGWEVERTLPLDAHGKVKGAHWELAGVPRELIRAMSSRSQEIDKLKQQYREETGKEADGVGFEKFLLNHRGPKSKRTAAELRREWIQEGFEHGYGPEAVAQAKARASERQATGIPARMEFGPEAEQLRQEILADLTREHALVPKRELDKLAKQRAQGLLDPTTAGLVVAEMFGDGDLLMTADGTKVTTLETLATEQRAIRGADQLLHAPRRSAAERERLAAEYREQEENGSPFDEAQREAIALAVSGARFVSITGPAGSGKGFASRAAVNIWHDQGRRVLALAVAGRTAQQAHVDSDTDLDFTLDGLQARTQHGLLGIQPTDVLLVDEAAMIDHCRYADLLELAAQTGATLVQVGDDKQLSPVEAGGLWTVTHQMADNVGLATELETIRRARNPAEAQAWSDLREGEVEKGLLWYRAQGRLHLYDSRPELLHGIVNEWWTSDPEGVMVLDTTNAERDSANRLAQAKRLDAGELGETVLQLANECHVRVGDRVIFHEIHQLNRDLNSFGPRIENGTVATVKALQAVPNDRDNQLLAERGQHSALLPAEHGVRASQYAAEAIAAAPSPANVAVLELHEAAGSRIVAVDTSVPLELAYARHVYKAQGMSAEVANIATGPETSQERLYVMSSRSRAGTHIHAVRVEVEDLGADPERIELGQQATAETQAEQIPAEPPRAVAEAQSAPITASELIQQLEQARAEQEARAEYVTVREIAAHAKPEAKQAIALEPPSWSQPVEPRAAQRQQDLGEHQEKPGWETDFTTDYDLNPRRQAEPHHERSRSPATTHQPSSDEIRATTRQRLQERLEAAHEAARENGRAQRQVPATMPAREATETVARGYAERGNTTELLALYRTMGRLEMTQDPERAAVDHASREPGSLIIAQDHAQRERLLGLLQERHQHQQGEHEAQRGGLESQPEPPSVVTAHDAYSQRAGRREQWVQQTLEARQQHQGRSEAFEHHVEPGAIEKATVVVTDPKDAQRLSRGLSGTAEAHLITGQPDWLTGEAVRLRSDQIQAQRTAQAEQQSQHQAEHTQEAQLQQATERSAQPAQAQLQAEHQGAER